MCVKAFASVPAQTRNRATKLKSGAFQGNALFNNCNVMAMLGS